ncbi:MAG: HAMP domain-containing sensor histidine kinase [Meiothermus sp.]|nr:HAMP domain-containing sensor histidine kinase [Meiothermus sp.]
MSFRTRLIVAYAILWLLIVAMTLAVAFYSINQGLYRQVENTLNQSVVEVAQLYGSPQAGTAQLPSSRLINISLYDSQSGLFLYGTTDQAIRQQIPKEYIQAAADTPKPYYSSRYMAAYQKIPAAVIAVSQDTAYIEEIGATARNNLLAGLAVMLVLGAFLIVFAARIALVPLHRAAQEVNKRGPRNLSRIEYTGPKDDLRVMVDRVNELLEALEDSRDRERAFLAEVSHELRTPLTSLNGYLERLSRNPTDAEMLERSRKIASHTARMVQDLLALARGEAERTVNAHVVSLGNVLRQAVGEYPGVGLKMPEEFPEVLGDPDRLLQLARNLIANAIRATGNNPHKVQVRVWMVREPTDNPPDPYQELEETKTTSSPESRLSVQPWAVFQVVDWGPGIPEVIMQRLFTRFARGPEGGTGLGLAICKQIAEAHGGEIRVASKPGETRFTVFLPLLLELDDEA